MRALLAGGLFSTLPAGVGSKVRVLHGDLSHPSLGLSAAQLETLRSEIEVVVHSAAAVNLNPPIHQALAHNYTATRNLLDVAEGSPRAQRHLPLRPIRLKYIAYYIPTSG